MKNENDFESFDIFLKESLRPYRRGSRSLDVKHEERRRFSTRKGIISIRTPERVSVWTWTGWLTAVATLLAAIFSHIVTDAAKRRESGAVRTETSSPATKRGVAITAPDVYLTTPANGRPNNSFFSEEMGVMEDGKKGPIIVQEPSEEFHPSQTFPKTTHIADERHAPTTPITSGRALLQPRNLGLWNRDTLSFADGKIGGTYEETDIRVVSEKVKDDLADFLVVGRWEGDAAVLTDLQEPLEFSDQAFTSRAMIRKEHRYLVRLPTAYGTISYLVEVVDHQSGEHVNLRWELLSPEAAISALAAKKTKDLDGEKRSTKTEIWAKPETRTPRKPTFRR